MLLGVKSFKQSLLRYAIVALIVWGLYELVFYLNNTWSGDMRNWKAYGGAAFFLLFFVVLIGPLVKIFPFLRRLSSWRREFGVGLAAVGGWHTWLILDGWVRWGFLEFFGYKYVPEIEQYLRSEPGWGLANLMGIVAITFIVILALTSFDRVVAYLGITSWKWLQSFTYVIFYLIALHAIYFAFIHYSPSPERVLLGMPTNYPDNPLAYYYLSAIILVFLAQMGAFIKTVYQQRKFAK